MRQALLQRALSLRRGELGQLGLGELIAQALESNSIDTKACIAGVMLLFSLFELVLASGLMLASPGSWPLLLLLGGMGSVVAWLLYRVAALHQAWYPAKLKITALQTEEMVGSARAKRCKVEGSGLPIKTGCWLATMA